MIRTKPAFLMLAFCCLLTTFSFAQNSTPKTLLWRISGKGLAKPSFLYGTMHLQDKRLFSFPDSLYYYLEHADGYALEIDMQEFIDSTIQRTISQREYEIIDKQRLQDSKEKRKIVDSLIDNVKRSNDKQSKKQLQQFRDEKFRKLVKNKEMPTIMDAWLYGIAKRQGKWLGGVEDVQDQLLIYDELGGHVSPEEIFTPDDEVKKSLEEMIKAYVDADLDKIEEMSRNEYAKDMEDIMLIKRNIKMGERMDSLSHIRTMFFAVGAAHLPGDSGVISLLRKKGYQVDPVISRRTIDPVKYIAKLSDAPWIKVEDEMKTYSVFMPGKASEIKMFNDYFTMKMFIDITSLTYYLSGSFAAPDKVDSKRLLENLADNTEGTILSSKTFVTDTTEGFEGVIANDLLSYTVRYIKQNNRAVIMMAGAEDNKGIPEADLKKFFNSLIIYPPKKDGVAEKDKWEAFDLNDKGLSVSFPGKPKRNAKIDASAKGTNWTFYTYDYMDADASCYYMLQVRDINPGYFIPADTNYFYLVRDNLSKLVDTNVVNQLSTYESYPSYRFEGTSSQQGVIFKTLTVLRGSRAYTLYTGGAVSEKVLVKADRFLNSLKLVPYKRSLWQTQTGSDGTFVTKAPAPFDQNAEGEDTVASTAPAFIQFISYDTVDCNSYHVMKSALDKYYTAENDSVLFEDMGAQYKREGDSVLSQRSVMNGKKKGAEWIFLTKGQSNLKKIRILVNGDSIYTLVAYLPAQMINDKDRDQFFSEFRLTNEKSNDWIYQSKSEKILTDLQSKDSATYYGALYSMDRSSFKAEDKTRLENALLADYKEEEELYRLGPLERVASALDQFTDSSTVEFIKKNFPRQNDKKEAVKSPMLGLLAKYRNEYSYRTFKDLILAQTPKEGSMRTYRYQLLDSMELLRTLYPEILSLSNNTLFAEDIIFLTSRLYEANMIKREMLAPYLKNFYHTADTIIANLKKETDDYSFYGYLELIELLGRLNDAESNRLLQEFLKLKGLDVKEPAAVALLTNKQTVDPKQITVVAADVSHRRSLYDSLLNRKLDKFFPAKYMTQQMMAESDMYMSGFDDDEPGEIKFIGTRIAEYKGSKKRFYLFKISYGEEEEKSSYLAVAGPYSMDIKNLKTTNEGGEILFDSEYDPAEVDNQFNKYLKDRVSEGETKK